MSDDHQHHPVARWVGRRISALVARRWLTLALVATTLAGILWGARIPIHSDMEALFPDDTPNVVRARRAQKILGSRSEMQVLIGGPDREVNRQVGAELADAFARHAEMVGSVEFRRDTAFFETNGLLFLTVDKLEELHTRVDESIKRAVAKELADGFDDFDDEDEDPPTAALADDRGVPTEDELRELVGAQDLTPYFESPDGQVIAVKVYPTFKPADTDRTQRLNALIEADVEAALSKRQGAGLSVTMEGDYSQVTAAVAQIKEDLATATWVAMGGICLILALYFRRLRAIFLVLVPLAVGLTWMVIFARAAIGSLNTITAFIFAILVGLGIDFAVHAVSRADEEFAAGHPLAVALPRAFGSLGRAMLAAALTTMATFAALSVFDFRGFSQFGILAAAGVLLCLLAVYVVIPALATALDDVVRRPQPASAPDAPSAAPATGRTQLGRGAAWALVGVFALLLGGAGLTLPGLAFEADMSKLRPKSSQKASELKTKYRKEAETRTASPALIITDGLEDTRALHRHLDTVKAERSERLKDVVSIFTFVPPEQERKLALVAEMKRKIDAKYGLLEGEDKDGADRLRPYLTPAAFSVDGLPGWVKEKFTDTEGNLGRYVLLYVSGSKSNAKEVLRIQDEIGRVELDGKVYHATASWMITGDAYALVLEEGPLAVALAGAVVILFLLLDLRRPGDAALAFVPIAIGFVLFLGLLAALDIPLTLFNVVVLPTIFGIGVDTSIHLVHRLKEGEGLLRVMRTTGGAAAISSATTAVGFMSLLFVDNEGIRSIGLVACLGILVCFVTCLSLTAAFVSLGWRPRVTGG